MLRRCSRLSLCALLGLLACKAPESSPPSPEPGSPDAPVSSPEQPPTQPPEQPEPDATASAGAGDEAPIVVSDAPCQSDADCVPAQCCHAAACTNTASAPDCSDAMCTEECRFGTLDCGGSCLCQEGKCAAKLSVAPQ